MNIDKLLDKFTEAFTVYGFTVAAICGILLIIKNW